MDIQSKAEFIRDKYGRPDYILLTLVSCSMVLSKTVEELETVPAPIEIVEDALRGLRESMTEKELLTVATMMTEISILGDDTNGTD
jgi:hypothetical protein